VVSVRTCETFGKKNIGLSVGSMQFSLIQRLRDIPLAFLDVETTGASADFGHRVIELGIVRVEGGRNVAEYQQLIDPQRRVSPGVTALTGISQRMVDGQPTFADQLPRAMELLRGAAVLGHNVRFDLSFLRKEFRRTGQEITEALGSVPVMDTVRIARRRFGRGGNGLQQLAPRLGYQPTTAHRALADAQTTAFVFEKLMEPVGGWDLCLCDALQQQGGPMGLLPVNPRESLLPLELEEALEQRRPVMMEYLDARNARTHRVIEPLHVRRSGGELLLIAHCQLRNDRRTFKLERIVQLSRLEAGVVITTTAEMVVASAPEPQTHTLPTHTDPESVEHSGLPAEAGRPAGASAIHERGPEETDADCPSGSVTEVSASLDSSAAEPA
jgi:DNA polymerase III epsilon subunit family exonuclease